MILKVLFTLFSAKINLTTIDIFEFIYEERFFYFFKQKLHINKYIDVVNF